MKFKKYIDDERMKKSRQKIESEAFKIVLWLILASALIKTNIFGFPITTAYFDIAILTLLCIFVNVKWIMSGVRIIKKKPGEKEIKKYIRSIIVAFVSAFGAAIVLGLIDYFVLELSFREVINRLWPIATALPLTIAMLRIIFDILSLKKIEKDISN